MNQFEETHILKFVFAGAYIDVLVDDVLLGVSQLVGIEIEFSPYVNCVYLLDELLQAHVELLWVPAVLHLGLHYGVDKATWNLYLNVNHRILKEVEGGLVEGVQGLHAPRSMEHPVFDNHLDSKILEAKAVIIGYSEERVHLESKVVFQFLILSKIEI